MISDRELTTTQNSPVWINLSSSISASGTRLVSDKFRQIQHMAVCMGTYTHIQKLHINVLKFEYSDTGYTQMRFSDVMTLIYHVEKCHSGNLSYGAKYGVPCHDAAEFKFGTHSCG